MHERASRKNAGKTFVSDIGTTPEREAREAGAKTAHTSKTFIGDASISVETKGGEGLIE
jgi:hypothetical protein